MNNNKFTLKLMRVDPVKYATIAAVATALIMLVIFVPMMLLFSAIGVASDDLGSGAAIFGGGLFITILAPIFYGVLVFIITLITTAILNFILKKTGGLDIDFEKVGLGISQIGSDNPRLEQ
ncbi:MULTISPECIES: hypothetical protein [Mesoflavibacter]|uniref:DUF3566 domain-containing protein n=1 Tax=Mesoflavibacter profundi TaxID=2708110 RepID=A0ABT4S0Z5_9FLAO|nr:MULTISPECIES: hypothetical protein [Mesoflavibacter]MDA0177734.1 hypothetical protein [Mesoflavibacter profundi]QIJ88694.1 hypothetical protein C7H62_0885 [Mesoflavibacter sp. HG96]QIJ91422.1 hypothetical protein C7H56_0885 [Mesoflavibacter sp. HG37]